MSSRRSRPLLIAPLIPAWAIVGFVASEWLRGTRGYLPFVAIWFLVAFLFGGYILRQAIGAKRARDRAKEIRNE